MTEERHQSPSFLTLRASSRRVLRLVEAEISRQGGGVATIYTDQLEICGSRRTYRPAMAELHALGLIEVTRHPKRYTCRLSNRWREIRMMHQALVASIAAREHRNDAKPNHVEHANAAPVA
jgi:hypothetical protein